MVPPVSSVKVLSHFLPRIVLSPLENSCIQTALSTAEEISKRDNFNGRLIDFTAWPQDKKIPLPYLLKEFFNLIISGEKEKKTHVIGLKIPSNNLDIMQIAIKKGFQFHNANPSDALLNLCLENHKVNQCSFPPFRTVSVGVTAVVFDRELKNVLVVMERIGNIKKFKPVTGGVDYGESGETPLDAAVRELKEEVQIDVDREKAIFVATGWANHYRGNNPDISNIFAFVIDQMQKPYAQQSEISKAKWMSIEEFMQEPSDENEKPWLLRQAVVAAFEAVINAEQAWKPRTVYLSTGKPALFFSALNKNSKTNIE